MGSMRSFGYLILFAFALSILACGCTEEPGEEPGQECGPNDCGGECGSCPDQHICNDDGKCECVPLSCDDHGVECGVWHDGCGGDTGECGPCPDQHICDENGQCECVPLSCDDQSAECGVWDDGCGGDTGECGPCQAGLACSLDGECVSEVPSGYSLIPAGEYTRGSPLDEPGRREDEDPHQVVVSRSFYLKQTAVTQGEWQSLMGTSPSYFTACGDDCPVEQIAYWDAMAFCNALSLSEGLPACYDLSNCTGTPGDPVDPFDCTLEPSWPMGFDCPGYRLPTEAEWEYAYRAGTTTALYNGDLVNIEYPPLDANLDAIAYYSGNSSVPYPGSVECAAGSCGTHPVGQKVANAWGLYDMAGNVWEWVFDLYGPYPEGQIVDPLGSAAGHHRILRGGAWNTQAWGCRAAIRHWVEDPNDRTGDRAKGHGFRPARTVE